MALGEELIPELQAQEAEVLALINDWETQHALLVQSAQDAAASAALAASYVTDGGSGDPDPDPDPDPEPQPNALSTYPNGTFSPTAYQSTASKMGTAEALSYLYGKKASEYGVNVAQIPTLHKPEDQSLDVISENYPGNNEAGRHYRPCVLGMCGTWQIGGPPLPGQGGMYSSNFVQAAFVPDNPAAPNDQGGIGVADMISWGCGENIVSARPELPWLYYGAGLDSINQKHYKGLGKNVSNVVCVGRGEGRPGWGISTLVATRGGFISTSGQNTGNNKAFVQLSAGKVPVAITCSNAHEFGFVAIWDTVNNKGQVAVLALAGIADGADINADPYTWDEWRGEWRGVFPGLPNYGNIAYMKVIGYIDLPPEIKCPTAVSASLFRNWEDYASFEGSYDMRLSATRARFRPGGNRDFAMPLTGILAVASREEKKVAFYDLRPLISYYISQYITEPGIGPVGDAAGQWPPTFTEATAQVPTLIKVLDFDHEISCMKLTRYQSNPRCYVGTEEGKLHIVTMGDYPRINNSPNPATLTEVGNVTVGRNPTYIGFVKQHPGDNGWGTKVYPGADFTREIIVTSRGDRKIDWVRMNSDFTGGAVIRSLQDTRLVDPIQAEDNDNHTTEHYEVTVADGAGKQIINYRYGPVVFWMYQGTISTEHPEDMTFNWTAGRPPDGIPVTTTTFNGVEQPFECSGQFTLPGIPYGLGMANVY